MKGLVVLADDGFVEIQTVDGCEPYRIEAAQIRSAEDAIIWLMHLTSKTWMNNTKAQQFISLAGSIAGFRVYR